MNRSGRSSRQGGHDVAGRRPAGAGPRRSGRSGRRVAARVCRLAAFAVAIGLAYLFDSSSLGVVIFLFLLLANVRVRWRWLDRIVANPEFHHWHHSSESDAVGHNYGAALPWWDLAFGTFFMPHRRTGRRPARYGVSEPLPRELLGQLTHPCRGARRHLWLWRHPILAIRTLAVATRNLLVDIRRSARRPTHSVRRWSAAGVATTNASLVGPDAVPKSAKRPLPSRHRSEGTQPRPSPACTG